MADIPDVLAFLRERLTGTDYAELVRRLGPFRNGGLEIYVESITERIRSGEFKPRRECRAYRIGPPRTGQQRMIILPTDERILELAAEHLPAEAGLEILRRSPDEILVRMAPRMHETLRKRFVSAVARETLFLI